MDDLIATTSFEPASLLAAIVESSDDAIVSKSLQGVITSWNKGAERIFGYTAAEVVGRPIAILIPEERIGEEPAILARIHAGERVDHFETVRRRKDGQLIDISLTISPIRAPDGTIVGASKIARDITQQKRSHEQQGLLLREMHHRIKNLFALTGGLLSLAARTAQTPGELAHMLRDRLTSLARAHDLTLRNLEAEPSSIGHLSIFSLVEQLLLPHQLTGRSRLVLEGEDLEVATGHVTNLALLFHEFATNAVKYGALREEEGSVHIRCSHVNGNYQMIWTERGGPPVRAPAGANGFGSKLENTLKISLGATILREWRPEGVIITVVLPGDTLKPQL